jgi:lipoprotein-releasing system permease protein
VKFSFYIATRYLKAKKSHNAINIISLISVVGISIGTFALIVVLSVFNGFESLVISLYNSFDPPVKITPVKGKFIDLNSPEIVQLKQLNLIEYWVPTLEENALIKYRDKQIIATIKGVPELFSKLTKIDSAVFSGEYHQKINNRRGVTVGNGIAYNLSLKLNDVANPLVLYLPRREKGIIQNPEDAFTNNILFPTGIFSIQQEFDIKYILARLDVLQEWLSLNNKVTALELSAKYNKHEELIAEAKKILKENYEIKNRYQQHELLYKIMRSEKWAVFLILSFILIIATFNVIGSLTILIVEKKKDIQILKSLGASAKQIQKIFLTEGLLITAIGAFIGLLLGYTVCIVQDVYGFIKLNGSGTFVIDAYPVKIVATDFLYVTLTVFIIGFIASWIPAKQLIKLAND